MEENKRIENVKLKQHATLTRNSFLRNGEVHRCWEFKSPDIDRDYEEPDLLYILDELSIEGWELVCRSLDDEGFILRTVDYVDDTVTYYDFDESELE
ncbi:hypothetical protein D3C76_422040 [compost metagenome]